MRRRHLYASSILVGMTVLSTMPALAQQIAQGGLEEIVVTARKVEESLMEVPMSIAAVTAADIQAANVKDLAALSFYTPGLWVQFSTSGPGTSNRQLTFRGLSVSSGLIFVDGAPFAGTGNPALEAVERIEALVGPQSAYFGRSTFSGAVNYVTKDPGDTFKGQIKGEYASFGTTDDSISLEGPIVPGKLTARVIGRHFAFGGAWTDAGNTSQKLGWRRDDSVFVTMVATPTDNLKAKMLLGFEDEDLGGFPSMALMGRDPNPAVIQSLFCNLGGTFGAYWCGALPKADEIPQSIISNNGDILPNMQAIFQNNPLNWPYMFDTSFKKSYGTRQQTRLAHLNLDYSTASGWNFSSITAVHKSQYQTIAGEQQRDNRMTANPNFGRVPNVLPWIGFLLQRQQIIYDASQELRVTSPQDQRLRGTLGGNWFTQRNPGLVNAGFQPTTVAISGSQTRSVSSTPAVFGGLYFDITDKLTVGAEARYQWDNIKNQVKYPTPGPEISAQYTSFSPRITVDYKYAPNSVVYALWSRGYRPGGFNSTLIGQSAAVLNQLGTVGASIAFGQEKLDNLELGWKATWLGGNLRTTIDGYLDKWRNGQVSQSISVLVPPTPPATAPSTFLAQLTTNVGAVDLSGIEADVNARITDHLTVAANFAWAHSKVVSYVSLLTARITGSTNVNGNAFPQAPTVVWSVSPTYTNHLAGDWDWYARVDWRHRGKYYVDISNVAWIRGSEYIDLHLGMRRDNLSIEGYVTNVTGNMNFIAGGQSTDNLCCTGPSNVLAINLGLPQKRTWGIKGSYSF